MLLVVDNVLADANGDDQFRGCSALQSPAAVERREVLLSCFAADQRRGPPRIRQPLLVSQPDCPAMNAARTSPSSGGVSLPVPRLNHST